MRRVPEVADAWFDSGAMPYAQWHYPFENQDEFDRQFPADFICEAIDQTRGWFYTLHAEAALLNASEAVPEEISFRNVICHGHILDEQGAKMSKSRGNVLEPFELLDQLGADAVRWYIYASAPVGSSRRFSMRLVNEGLRRFQLTLWNVYSFFVSYANIDGLDPRERPGGETPELDRWLLSELNALTERVTAGLDDYDPTVAARAIEGLRRRPLELVRAPLPPPLLARRLGGGLPTSAAPTSRFTPPLRHARGCSRPSRPSLRRSCGATSRAALDGDAPESVHLADWPEPVALEPGGSVFVDESLNAETQLVKRIASMGRRKGAQKRFIQRAMPLSRCASRQWAATRGAGDSGATEATTNRNVGCRA